jgi:branched-chain amino acid transport system ATP-binding protein
VIELLPADMAIMLIEHDMQVVRRFATNVTVLVAGTI